MIFLLFTFLLWNIQMSGQYPNWDSKNVFIRICFCLKLINLDNLRNTSSFLHAFLHSEITWSSKVRFLPISIPSNFCFPLPQIFSSSILTQTFSYLCPETKRWHLSLLSFMLLVSNYSIAKKTSCSNLLIRLFRSLSQAWNVVSSAKLRTFVKSER